ATIASLRSIHHAPGKGLHYAGMADSADGWGAPLPPDSPTWPAFGYDSLPAAPVGFAIASPALALKEGIRVITIRMHLNGTALIEDLNYLKNDPDAIRKHLSIQLSGEEEWHGPVFPQAFRLRPHSWLSSGETGPLLNIFSLEGAQPPSAQQVSESKISGDYWLECFLTLDEEAPPIVPFNQDQLPGLFTTSLPVLRFLADFQPETDGAHPGYHLFRALSALSVLKVNIEVDVSNIRSLSLENGQGPVDASKPFYPFGPQPVKRSGFYIGYDEVFEKNWSEITLRPKWMNLPADLVKHYEAYRKEHTEQLSRSKYQFQADKIEEGQVKQSPGAESAFSGLFEGNSAIVQSEDYFQVQISVLDKTGWGNCGSASLFKGREKKEGVVYHIPRAGIGSVSSPPPQRRLIRLSLEKDFLHSLYPRLYAVAFAKKEEEVIIPNEPYTPLIEELTMSYRASMTHYLAGAMPTGTVLEEKGHYYSFQFFHEHPFGQHRQYGPPNGRVLPLPVEFTALPRYPHAGELLIGLQELAPPQIVSFHIQVAEGSENPEHATFEKRHALPWSILCANEWKTLDDEHILKDDTNNLLVSGIVRLLIPGEASLENTLLPPGLYWLRLSLPPGKKADAVCRLLSIKPQALSATRVLAGERTAAQAAVLPPGTIQKMARRLAAVAKVQQPYSSFEGRAEESNREFYTRISERLRHKNRAATLWDYERLVLQAFPEIYKVKCLSHTSPRSTRAPGHITMVIIPDIRKKMAFDKLAPKASKNFLTRIEQFLQQLCSPQVVCHAANASFEPVLLSLKVSFREGFDPSHYKKRLNEELVNYLTPWAADNGGEIHFGGAIHKSTLIQFVESRSYVDFITEVEMYQYDSAEAIKDTSPADTDEAQASQPGAVLASASSHEIGDV
ncbi:MAG: baseplate J/gp47 family protein, partial [Phaeodactylibacter sp.]|nr:baseplate J/gp47 family protein [Phaeodactylibacter sp.]